MNDQQLLQRVAAARVRWQLEQARPAQLPPEGDWYIWMFMAGRGAGKTRTAAEWLAFEAVRNAGTRWAIVAPTFGDARDTCVEGESGILTVLERYGMLKERNAWNRSIGEVRLRNGSNIKLFSGDEPERFRGPQHHGAWVDELGSFKYEDAWEQLQFGLRLGSHPQIVVTTTPRPRPLIKKLLARTDGSVVVTRGSTFDNQANLAPTAISELRARYEGTRLGRQELYGELIDDVEGAVWTYGMIDPYRLQEPPERLARIIVAVDPSITDTGDETGIIVCARDGDGHGYVLEDCSMRGTPDQWARVVVAAYERWEADGIVVEVNQGGQMVTSVLNTVQSNLPIKAVRAAKGKKTRAEPISALYEQGRIHHIGLFETLETQLTSWTSDIAQSPDRLDALVWGMTELFTKSGAADYLRYLSKFCACGFPNPKSAGTCSSCKQSLPSEESVA